MRVLACPALKGPCQLRGIVCSLSQGPWVTQSPRTGPSPWPTLWIRAQTVSAGGGGAGQLPRSSVPPSSLSCSPAGAWGGGWPHPHFTVEEPGRTVPSPSPACTPRLLALCTRCHMKCVFQGSLGMGAMDTGEEAGQPQALQNVRAREPGLQASV